MRVEFSKGTRTLAKFCGRITAVSDFYDAATKRKNDKFSPGNPRLLTSEESKRLLLENNRDQEYLIKQLYQEGIFI